MGGNDELDTQQIRRMLRELWPVAKGSLSRVRKPCVRANCKACASGEKHPAWLFTFRQAGRQRCMYVADRAVPLLQKALENGRKLEQLTVACGAALVSESRRRDARSTSRSRRQC
jgi:hypothetical protein